MFLWPTTTKRVTSQFRPSHRKNHNGIDIAESGTHNVFAVADGTVTRSYTSTSYGECIFILHNIGGQTWETVYAHLRSGSRKVREGQKVSKGQTIGIMGNTGHSTGQHLHFELHKGRWNINKSNAVDPLKYLEKEITSNEVDKTLHLPKTAKSWRIYPTNKTPTKGNEVGFLRPSKFGGLTYDIIGNPQKDVYTIQTRDFGKVNIYAGKDTSAKIVTIQKDFRVGQKVKIKSSAKNYPTGAAIPTWAKNKTYTIQQVKSDQVLLKEIVSWVYKKDVQ